MTKKKKKWYPSKHKKYLSLIFKQLISSNDFLFGKIEYNECGTDIKNALEIILPESKTGILYVIKKIEGEYMYSICIRDIDGVESGLSDLRHSIKNYLNGLVWAEYELNGNNNIIRSATNEVNKIQITEILQLFFSFD